MSNTNFKELHDQISGAFNDEELRGLCHDLGIDYESLGGWGKAANVREGVGDID